MMLQRKAYASIVVFVVVALLVANVVDASDTMTRVFVLHRHGARTPQGITNGTLNCNPPFCRLTDFGKAQCFEIGKQLEATYGTFLKPFMPTGYNVTHMHSVSTAVPRVVLSAQSVIIGMFPDALPFVDFVPVQDDIQMSYWNSWPAWKLWDATKTVLPSLNPLAVNTFSNINGVNYLERFQEFSNLTQCTTDPQACLTFMNDYVSSSLANNISVPADIVAVRPQLLKFTAKWFATLLGYDPITQTQKKNIGSFGYPLARAAIEMLTSVPTKDEFDYKFIHRGAHDWTIFALYGAMGAWVAGRDNVDTRFVVQFAETVILELWEIDPANTTDRQVLGAETYPGKSKFPARNDNLYIKAKYWVPTQPTQINFNYTVAKHELMIRCIPLSADGKSLGTPYTASQCPVNDVLRQIESTRAEDDREICYWTQAQLESANCLTNDAPTNDSCLFFRQRCPNAPCGTLEDSVADPAAGYMCVSLSVKNVDSVATAAVVVVGVSSLVIGIVMGYVVFLWRYPTKFSSNTQAVEIPVD